jgi:hypothetical protein
MSTKPNGGNPMMPVPKPEPKVAAEEEEWGVEGVDWFWDEEEAEPPRKPDSKMLSTAPASEMGEKR